MSHLDSWLQQATRHLSKDSAAQVRTEIQAHYESAREDALSAGATAEEADRLAVAAFGDAQTANRQYRGVLLTSAEARLLREGNCEARAICSRPWLKWLMRMIPLAALLTAVALFLNGSAHLARVSLAGAAGLGLIFAAPFLPVYTPLRARIFRVVKWVVLIAALELALGPSALKSFWLLASCLWPLIWIEWTRISIRRKLPVAQWPRQLYL